MSSNQRDQLLEVVINRTCLLCDKPAGSEDLHNASTYDIDGKVCMGNLQKNH